MDREGFLKRRVVLQGLAISALATVFPVIAQAAGPSLKPVKIGQKVVWRGYIYTVVSSKGKLVWKKGSKVAATTISTAKATKPPTPTTSTTPSNSPSPAVSEPEVTSDGVFAVYSTELTEGQVKIIEVNTAKNQYPSFAFSRLDGKLSAVSMVCTHAGCKVVAEKTELICNCHVSYFNPRNGAAISGPAKDPLTRYEVTQRGEKSLLKFS